MPPKKKGAALVIDGVDTSEMTREKLEQFTLAVKTELDKEREQRNAFQLERDKLRAFWEITRVQLEEARALLRERERESERQGEENDETMKFQLQRVKHLQYEQLQAECALRADGMAALKKAREEHAEQESELLVDKRNLRLQLREQELAGQRELRRAALQYQKELSDTRQEFEERAREIEGKAEKRLQTAKTELTVKHRMELSEVEERKNKQLADLIADHEKAFTELKDYYNDITLNNLGLIASLKAQMEDLQGHRERAEKAAADANLEVRRTKDPLEKALAENLEMKRQSANYEKDKAALATKTRTLASLEKQFEVLKWENEVLEMRFERVRSERDELHSRFARAVLELQQKMAAKATLLDRRFSALQLEATRASLPKNIQELLEGKEMQLDDLRYEVARLRKAHDDLLATYEAKLTKLGVPKAELGFRPLRAAQLSVGEGGQLPVGRGPAGLVARNN